MNKPSGGLLNASYSSATMSTAIENVAKESRRHYDELVNSLARNNTNSITVAVVLKQEHAAQSEKLNPTQVIETRLATRLPSMPGPKIMFYDPISVQVDKAHKLYYCGQVKDAFSLALKSIGEAEQLPIGATNRTLLCVRSYMLCASILMHSGGTTDEIFNYINKCFAFADFKEHGEEYLSLIKLKANASLLINDLDTVKGLLSEIQSHSESETDKLNAIEIEGYVDLREGRNTDAISRFRECEALTLKLIALANDEGDKGKFTQNRAVFLNLIGISYRETGNHAAACDHFRKASDILKNTIWQTDRAVFLANYGASLLNCANVNKAISILQEAHKAIDATALTEEKIYCLENLGRAYCANEEFENGKECFESALGYSTTDASVCHLHRLLASLSTEAEDYDAAKQHLDAAHKLATNNELNVEIAEIYEQQTRLTHQKEREMIKRLGMPDNTLVLDVNAANEDLKPRENVDRKVIETFIEQLETESDIYKRTNILVHIAGMLCQRGDISDSCRYVEEAYSVAISIGYTPVIADALLIKAHNAMHKGDWIETEKAGKLITQARETIGTLPLWGSLVYCEWYDGLLCAHRNDFAKANKFFNNALEIIKNKSIHDDYLLEALSSDIDHVKHLQEFSALPNDNILEMYKQLYTVQAWYPKYSAKLKRIWYYANTIKLTRTIKAEAKSQGIFLLHDEPETLKFYSLALSGLFNALSYSIANKLTEYELLQGDMFPIPDGIDWPLMLTLSLEESSQKVKEYIFLVPTSPETRYSPFHLIGSTPDDNVAFDMSRRPKPITVAYRGYEIPKTAIQTSPLLYSNEDTILWWSAYNLHNTDDVIVEYLCRTSFLGAMPIIGADVLVKSSAIRMVDSLAVNIPYYHDNGTNIENSVKETLKKLTRGFTNARTAEEAQAWANNFESALKSLPKAEDFITIKVAVIEFPYSLWRQAPTTQKVCVALILPTPINIEKLPYSENIRRDVTELCAVNELQTIGMYGDHDFFEENWQTLDKIDSQLQQLFDASSDKITSVMVLMNGTIERIAAFGEKNTDRKPFVITGLKRVIGLLEDLRLVGFEDNTHVMEGIAHGYILIAHFEKDCEFSYNGLMGLYNEGLTANETIMYYTICALPMYAHIREDADIASMIAVAEAIRHQFPTNAKIARPLVSLYIVGFYKRAFDERELIKKIENVKNNGFENETFIAMQLDISLCMVETDSVAITNILRRIELRAHKRAAIECISSEGRLLDIIWERSQDTSVDIEVLKSFRKHLDKQRKTTNDEAYFNLVCAELSAVIAQGDRRKEVAANIDKINALALMATRENIAEDEVNSIMDEFDCALEKIENINDRVAATVVATYYFLTVVTRRIAPQRAYNRLKPLMVNRAGNIKLLQTYMDVALVYAFEGDTYVYETAQKHLQEATTTIDATTGETAVTNNIGYYLPVKDEMIFCEEIFSEITALLLAACPNLRETAERVCDSLCFLLNNYAPNDGERQPLIALVDSLLNAFFPSESDKWLRLGYALARCAAYADASDREEYLARLEEFFAKFADNSDFHCPIYGILFQMARYEDKSVDEIAEMMSRHLSRSTSGNTLADQVVPINLAPSILYGIDSKEILSLIAKSGYKLSEEERKNNDFRQYARLHIESFVKVASRGGKVQ